MRYKAFIYLAVALLFAACDSSTQEEKEEELRLDDIYHLEKVEFYLSGDDGLSVTERDGIRRTTHNETSTEVIVGFKDEDTFTSVFRFEDDQPYTLVIDTLQKIRVPGLLENNVLYMGQDEVWPFRNIEPEERLTGSFSEHTWNVPAMCQTVVDHTVRTSIITASFDACFIGENTHSEVIIQGKWEGREVEYLNYRFVTDEIK